MLQYSNDQTKHASHVLNALGLDGLIRALASVTLEMGRGREVVVPKWLSNAVAADKSEALTHLAGLHLGALRDGKGLVDAEPLLRRAAQNGYAPAQEQLGIISLFGVGCEQDPGGAAGWLRLAADQGEKRAQSLLGMMLAAGTSIDRNLPEARQLLAEAGDQGEAFARLCLNSGSGLGLLPQMATLFLGILRVMAAVSSSLPDNAGDDDIQRGITALADAGDADANLFLAILCQSTGDRTEALHRCLLAAGAGNELAVLMLGLLAFTDHDGIRYHYPAAEWLDAAARKGSAPAQALLGLMYATGRGVTRNASESARLLGNASEGMDTTTGLGRLLGSLPMLEVLAHLFGKIFAAQMSDQGSSPSDGPINMVNEAMLLAEQGDRFAQFFIGMSLWTGQDVTQNQAEGVTWMLKAAGQGHKEAQFFMGTCFHAGDGVELDLNKAVHWFRSAAEQGHVDAQYALACACMLGKGVEQDMVEAVRWLRLAAEQGDLSAQYHFAIALMTGDGLEEDINSGLRWLLKAADEGSQEAQDTLRKIAATDLS